MTANNPRSPSTQLNTPQPTLHRVLGLSGLTFFLVAALVNLNSVPVGAAFGLTVAFIPSSAVDDPAGVHLKTTLGTLSFLTPAVALFAGKARQLRMRKIIAPAVKVAPE